MRLKIYLPLSLLVLSSLALNGQTPREFKSWLRQQVDPRAQLELQAPIAPATRLNQQNTVVYRLDSLSDRYRAGSSWIDGSTSYFHYDSQQLLAANYTVAPQVEVLEEYSHNSAGQLTEYKRRSGDSSSGSWENEIRRSFGYYSTSQLAYRMFFRWDTTASQWGRIDSTVFAYLSGGEISSLTNYSWNDSIQQWQLSSKVDYSYNAGRITLSQTQLRDSSGSSWQPYLTRTYRHNSAGYVRGYTVAAYRPNTASWDSTFKAEYDYDQNFNPIEERYLPYNPSTQSFVNFFGYRYQYDTNVLFDDLLAPARDQFVPDYRDLIHNQPISYQPLDWSQSQSQWEVTDSVTYHYSQQPVNLNEVMLEELSSYPNPASDKLSFDLPQEAEIIIEVFNILGQKVMQARLSSQRSLDIGHLKPGSYTLRLHSGEQWYATTLLKK